VVFLDLSFVQRGTQVLVLAPIRVRFHETLHLLQALIPLLISLDLPKVRLLQGLVELHAYLDVFLEQAHLLPQLQALIQLLLVPRLERHLVQVPFLAIPRLRPSSRLMLVHLHPVVIPLQGRYL
jgi:hypothetical protein